MVASSSKKISIAILTRPDYKSPRILADSLKQQLEREGAKVDLYFSIDALTRLDSYNFFQSKIKFHFWLRRKLLNYFNDSILLKKLKSYDAVIISECSPNGFWKELYKVEKLKQIIKKPVLFYEVYYLENAPTQVEFLKRKGDPLTERYDWHLSVTSVTEIRSNKQGPWSCIGIDLSKSGLGPNTKKEFIALVDFMQPGFEKYHEKQIKVLQELNITTIVLNGSYSLEEIRAIYKKASVFFIQFPEAFGLPIAECLACGAQIITPNSGWPMSWRLDDTPEVHGEGILPDMFYTYSSYEDLKQMLIRFKDSYDLEQTPQRIFKKFIEYYPHYYFGNSQEINKVLSRIKSTNFS